MQLLPKWVLANRFPAIHDFESLSVIEQTARIYGAMNELIEEYNAFADSTNKSIEEFQRNAEADREQFEISMSQQFQDFIDIVDLRLRSIDQIVKNAVDDAISSGKIAITEEYDQATESLNMVIK